MAKNAQGRYRPNIGFLISQLDGRYQSPLWHGVVDVAEENDANLIFFVGKSLAESSGKGFPEDFQHNIVYELVDAGQLDGIIVTSAALSNFVGKEAFLSFFEPFLRIPCVSIALPMEGVPCVLIDNKSGMRKVVQHLILEHGFTKIAFLQGPPLNMEAMERYEAYLDVLKENEISVDESLVVPGDFGPLAGELGVKELLKRKVKFQALCCANDDMAMGAYHALVAAGFNVPGDVAMTGFDDIEEVRFIQAPLTTVRQPFYEQGKKAAEILLLKMRGETVPEKTYLPTELIVRDSCGCKIAPYYSETGGRKKMSGEDYLVKIIDKNRKRIVSEILASFDLSTDKMERFDNFLNKLLDAFLLDIEGRNNAVNFINELNRILNHGFIHLDELNTWHKALFLIREPVLSCIPDLPTRDQAKEIFYKVQVFMDEINQQVEAQRRIKLQKSLWYIRNFMKSIGSCLSLEELLYAVAGVMPQISLKGCYLSLFSDNTYFHRENPPKIPEISNLIVAYKENENISPDPKGVSVPTFRALANVISSYNRRLSLVVQSLFSRNEHFGFIFCELGPLDEILYGLLREQISSTLKSVQLFQNQVSAEYKLKEALSELKNSEERYKEIALFLPTVIMETDLAMQITFLNQIGKEYFGIENHSSLFEFIHPDEKERLREHYSRIIQGKEADFNEFRITKKDGNLVTLLTKAAPILKDGMILGVRWNGIDIKSLLSSFILPEDAFFTNFNLSMREREVLNLILQGYRNKEIASKLFIAESTVKTHVGAIYSELGVKSKEELFAILKDYQIKRFGYNSYVFSLLSKLMRDEDM